MVAVSFKQKTAYEIWSDVTGVQTCALPISQLLLADDKATDAERCERAHQRAFGRPPTAEEQLLLQQFLTAYLQSTAAQARPEAERRLSAWQSFCQSLFCANEFLYLE